MKKKMDENNNDWFSEMLEGMGEFKPVVWYDDKMDYLTYINEDVSYVAMRQNPMVDYLRHPYDEKKLVGWRVNGFIYFFGKEKFEEIKLLIDKFLTPEIAEKYLKTFEEMWLDEK